MNSYKSGKEIPKVEFIVASKNPREPLFHTIKFTGMNPPRNYIVIQRPIAEPPEQKRSHTGEL